MVLEVSFATVLQQSENVLPCYNIVQNQIRPEVQETPGRCEAQLTIRAYSGIQKVLGYVKCPDSSTKLIGLGQRDVRVN